MTTHTNTESTHCDHECVCNWLACNVNCVNLDDPCGRKNCEHDTRTIGIAQRETEFDIFKMCWELHDNITDPGNCLSLEEICGSLEEIAEASTKRDSSLIAQEREKWERERGNAPTFDEVAEEVRLTDSGFVRCNLYDEECDDCGQVSKTLYTHPDYETGEVDAYRCPECAKKWNDEKRLESLHCKMMANFENNDGIATQAREDVLNRLEEKCTNARSIDNSPEVNFAYREMLEWIQAIRLEVMK